MSASGSGPAFGERAEYGENDVCYRHPDVHSFTLCQRCGRTICPDCQTASAVGVLCRDCVKQTQPGTGQRVARSARVTGRRFAASDSPVTYGIMIVSAVVFAGQLLTHYFGDSEITRWLWYAPVYSLPDSVSGMFFSDVSFQPWRMLTVMFTHSTGFIFHILFNMYALWLFGRNLEQMIGRARFLLLYLFSGLGGSLGVMLWVYADPESVLTPTVGASGAIFGVLAATLVAFKAANANVSTLAVLIAVNFGIGLLPGSNISWQAHLGGLLVGAATMGVMLATRGPRKKGQAIAAISGLGVLLVALACAYLVVLPGLSALFTTG